MDNNLEYLKKLFTEEVGESVNCIEIVEKDGEKGSKLYGLTFTHIHKICAMLKTNIM